MPDEEQRGEEPTVQEADAANRAAREELERSEREAAGDLDRLAASAPEGEGEAWRRQADELRDRADETARRAPEDEDGDA